MIDAVIARLKTQVSDLGGRVEGAAEFTALMQKNALPQVTPAAHVLPLGLQGGQAQSAAGAYTQMFEEAVGVVLTVRGHDQTGARALARVSDLIRGVIAALIGWGPDDEVGVFQLARGQLVSIRSGTLVYQLDFTITDQLRSMT